jgi:hypothetical protein
MQDPRPVVESIIPLLQKEGITQGM